MPFGGGKIYKPSLREEIYPAVAAQQILFAIGPNCPVRSRAFFELRDIYLAIVVAGVRHNSAIFEQIEMPPDNHVLHARRGDEYVTDLCGLVHRHDTHSFKRSL